MPVHTGYPSWTRFDSCGLSSRLLEPNKRFMPLRIAAAGDYCIHTTSNDHCGNRTSQALTNSGRCATIRRKLTCLRRNARLLRLDGHFEGGAIDATLANAGGTARSCPIGYGLLIHTVPGRVTGDPKVVEVLQRAPISGSYPARQVGLLVISQGEDHGPGVLPPASNRTRDAQVESRPHRAIRRHAQNRSR